MSVVQEGNLNQLFFPELEKLIFGGEVVLGDLSDYQENILIDLRESQAITSKGMKYLYELGMAFILKQIHPVLILTPNLEESFSHTPLSKIFLTSQTIEEGRIQAGGLQILEKDLLWQESEDE